MDTALQHNAAILHRTTFFLDVQLLALPPFGLLYRTTLFLAPCGAVSDIARGRPFERHYDPASHPDSTTYQNRSYDQSWTLVPRATNAGAPSLLPTWDDGSEAELTPEYSPVPLPNDPRHLPPPSEFESIASATVHPRLANPPIGRSNDRFIRLAAAVPPNRRVANESFPFRIGASHRAHQLPPSFRPPFNATEQTLSRPLSNANGFHRAALSRPHSLPSRRTCRFLLALLRPVVLPKSRLAPVSADPAQTTAHNLHACNHTRSNRATVLGSRLSC